MAIRGRVASCRARRRVPGRFCARPQGRRLLVEPLESRLLLSVDEPWGLLQLGAEAEPRADVLASAMPGPLGDTNDAVYLLITSESLSSSFQPLVDRRTAQGKPGTLVTTEWIDATYDGTRPDGGADLQTKIRNCIIDHYQNHGTLWVALGGDDAVVPVRFCVGNYPTDLYYGDLEGTWDADADGIYAKAQVDGADLLPEVWVGRIPVRTATQATGYIDKVVRYETASPEGYANTMLLVGRSVAWDYHTGSARGPGYIDHEFVSDGEIQVVNQYRNPIATMWQATPQDVLCDTMSSWDTERCGDYDLNGSHLFEKLNTGYHHVLISTHGWTGGIALEGSTFGDGSAAALTNRDRLSIVFAISCSTAGFDIDEPSLSEGFLRNPNGGAVVYIGASRSTTGRYDYFRQFYTEMYANHRETVGEAFARAKMAFVGTSSRRQDQFNWNFQGDPALVLLPEETTKDLQVSSPHGCEQYDLGVDVRIYWNASGTDFAADERVKLEYSADSGQTWASIPGAESLPYNGGLFIWEDCPLPAAQPAGTAEQLKPASVGPHDRQRDPGLAGDPTGAGAAPAHARPGRPENPPPVRPALHRVDRRGVLP